MKINEHTALSTPTVLLVPYSESHVPTYHEWMQDAELQAATASEPLSLEEEFAMQKSWRDDRDKLTFIICLPCSKDESDLSDAAPDRMIGDINLFLFPPGSEEMEQDVQAITPDVEAVVGEVELMIARKDLQRKGYGRAALLTFLEYILAHWETIAAEYAQSSETSSPPNLSFLRVKVQEGNAGSIRLFESVGFGRTVEEANYFGEVELRWLPDLKALRGAKGWEESMEVAYS